jgi:hypothetical protein
LFESVGLKSVTARAIDIPTVFQNFDDYWNPFLGRTGAAPIYLGSVGNEVRERIRLCLKSRLVTTQDGRIEIPLGQGRSGNCPMTSTNNTMESRAKTAARSSGASW